MGTAHSEGATAEWEGHYGIWVYGYAEELVLVGRRLTASTDRLLLGHTEGAEPADQLTCETGYSAGRKTLPQCKQANCGWWLIAQPAGPIMCGGDGGDGAGQGSLGVNIIASSNGLGGP